MTASAKPDGYDPAEFPRFGRVLGGGTAAFTRIDASDHSNSTLSSGR